MAQFITNTARMVKSEMRKREARRISEEVFGEFKSNLENSNVRSLSLARLNQLLSQEKIRAIQTYKRNVQQLKWKAMEEFKEESRCLSAKIDGISDVYRKTHTEAQRNKLYDFQRKILEKFQTSIKAELCNDALPSREEYAQLLIQAGEKVKGTYWGFIDDNQMNRPTREEAKEFEVQVMNHISNVYEEFLNLTSSSNSDSIANISQDGLGQILNPVELSEKCCNTFLEELLSLADQNLTFSELESLIERKMESTRAYYYLFMQQLKAKGHPLDDYDEQYTGLPAMLTSIASSFLNKPEAIKERSASVRGKLLQDLKNQLELQDEVLKTLYPSENEYEKMVTSSCLRTRASFWDFTDEAKVLGCTIDSAEVDQFEMEVQNISEAALKSFRSNSQENAYDTNQIEPDSRVDDFGEVSQSQQSNEDEMSFVEDEEVIYRTSNREIFAAKVVKVHREMLPWYFTVKIFCNGRERQTDSGHLIKIPPFNASIMRNDQEEQNTQVLEGEEVLYRDSSTESFLLACIMNVHREEVPFYFSIKLYTLNRERQTDSDHLLRLKSIFTNQDSISAQKDNAPTSQDIPNNTNEKKEEHIPSNNSRSEGTKTDDLPTNSQTQTSQDDPDNIKRKKGAPSTVSHPEETKADDLASNSDQALQFSRGEKVIYQDSSGKSFLATISEIHLEDGCPFFSVKIHDTGRERNTDSLHLKKLESFASTSSLKPLNVRQDSSSKGHSSHSEEYIPSCSFDDVGVCCICLERPKSVVLLPCKHLCVCDHCYTNNIIEDCPICCQKVSNALCGVFA